MSWYSFYKWFIAWRKTPYTDWIFWYKKYLYDEWFASLSEMEKQKELKRIEQFKEKEIENRRQIITNLCSMIHLISETTHGR